MVRLRRCFLILATLISGAVSLHGGSSSEDRAYGVAERAFNLPSWAYAEEKFGEFVQKYPKSPRVPGAILFQARARFQLNRFADVIGLLSANRAKAGMWGDEYLYWTAQAHLQTTNFEAAADILAQLCKDFPNSPRRLEAAIEEATALARLGEWSRVTELLEDPDGVLQEAASSDPTDAFVLRGRLLLGEAKLALKNFSGVQAALDLMSGRAFDPELMWRREYLRCRLQLALGQPEQALVNSGRLLVLAGAPPGTNEAPPQADAPIPRATIPAAGLLSESWSFRAAVLERLNRPDDAIAAYSNNLVASAPVDQQRQALFKIAGLHLAQGQYALAIESLEDYLNRHPDSGAADMALLTIGELQLKQSELAGTNDAGGVAPAGAGTNLVRQALGRFDTLLAAFPHSPLTGKAFLDKGWCLWTDGRYGPSAEAFRLAAERLPFSEDQAVARFKWADAQFMMQDYAEAATNYIYVVGRYGSLAGVGPQFFELALYQTVRAALPNDGPAATEALRKILESYPDGFAGPHALLFSGQRFTRQNDPAGARGLFADFEKRYPDNELLPEVRLGVARSYEQEKNWEAAAREYSDWIREFTNHVELPRAEFYRAWDGYMAGQETNAFVLFTNFIARFPTHELARDAQYWTGDYYWRHGDFQNAEINYQLVFKSTNWPVSELSYQAQMMAGRAAVARQGYKDAIAYFTNLAANPACPLDSRVQATIACGDSFAMRAEQGATNRPADLQEAISWFNTIPQTYPTHPLAPLAWGRVGDCSLQLGDSDPKFHDYYAKAANAYQQVAGSPRASVAARSQATVGLGLVAEAMGKLKSGEEQAALLKQALNDYQDVFLGNVLRDGELSDPFWVKKAGMEAARLAESLQQWRLAIDIYRKLQEQDWLPQTRASLEKKILNAQQNLPGANP